MGSQRTAHDAYAANAYLPSAPEDRTGRLQTSNPEIRSGRISRITLSARVTIKVITKN